MGNSIGNYVLFPGAVSYDESLDGLIWIPETFHPGRPTSGRFIPALLFQDYPQGSPHVLLYLHGNSCDLGDMRDELSIIQQHANCSILAIEFPGYGVCAGKTERPTAEGIDTWATAAIFWLLHKGVAPHNIVVFGRSIGTGPAARLAESLRCDHQLDIGGLALHCPFKSIHEILDDYSWLGRHVVPNHWDSSAALQRVQKGLPLLVIHGENDEVIPIRHGRELFEEYEVNAQLKEGVFPPDSEHNSYSVVYHVSLPLKSFLEAKSLSRFESPCCVQVAIAERQTPLMYRTPHSELSAARLPSRQASGIAMLRGLSVPMDTPVLHRSDSSNLLFRPPTGDLPVPPPRSWTEDNGGGGGAAPQSDEVSTSFWCC